MAKKSDSLVTLLNSKWFRLGFSLTLALAVSLISLLIPITAGTSFTLSVSPLAQDKIVSFPLPFGAAVVRAANGLTITKVANSSTVDQGGLLTYTLIITNGTGADITGQEIVVTDTVPANTTCFDVFDNGPWFGSTPFCEDNNLAFWTKSSLFVFANNSVVSLTYVVSTSQPLPDQSQITNLATSYSISTSTIFDTGVDTVNTTVNAPNWQISKVADPSPFVEPGNTITYTITVTNNGHLATTGDYTITDAVPTNTDFVSASSPGGESGGNVTWVLTNPLGIGVSTTVSYVVVVTEPLTNAVEIVNQTYSITGGNVFSEASGPPVIVTIQTPVTLTITKLDDPDPVQAGDLLNYTLTVTNDSSSKGPASDVVVTDTVPANTSLVEAGFVGSASGLTTNTGSSPGSVVTWTLDNPNPLAIGEQVVLSMTLRVDSPLTNGTVITNDVYGVGVSNELFTVNSVVPVTTVVESAPILSISKEGLPEPVSAGGQLTYTIRFSNTGNANATDVLISDTFPISTSYVGDVSEPPGVSPGITSTTGITWNIPFLAGPDGGGVITLTVSVDSPQDPGTVLTNVVSITSSEVTTPALATATNTVSSTPELHIRKSAEPSPVARGSTLVYTIVFSNSGNANANNAIITDVLDSRVTFDSASDGGILNGGVVNWTNLSVPTGGVDQTLVLTVTVAPTLPHNSILQNNVEIAAGSITATDSITTLVQAPALTITKIVSPTGVVRAGDNIEYTIIYTNTGPITAPNIFITDTFPVSITNVLSSTDSSDGNPPVPQTTPFVWVDDEVPPNGGLGVITITGQVITSPWASTGGNIINDVIVAGNGYSATTTATIQGRPGLPVTITVVAVPPSTTVGNTIAVTATAVDAYGNDVFDGTPVTLSSSLSGSQLLPGSPSTSNGQVNATLSSNVAGTTTVTAQIPGESGTITNTTVATFTPDVVIGFVLQATTPQTAGVSFPITIRAVDRFSNTVTTLNQLITISDTTGTIAPTSALLVGGIATAPFTVTQATSPTLDIITAISGTITGTVGVVIQPNTPTNLNVTVNPTTIRVCQTANVTSTITDNFGNPILGRAVIMGVLPGSLATVLPDSGVTNSAGVFNSILTGRGGGTPNVTAQSGLLSGSTGITINTPPVPTNLTLTVAPNPLATGGNTAIATATVSDCFGPSAGQVVTFTVSNALVSLPSTPFAATTNSSGVATATLTSGSTDGTVVVTATVSGLAPQTVTVTLQTAALTITKTANPVSGTEVRPGQTINYTLQITNQGSGPASTVVITDVLPTGVNFGSVVSCSSGAICVGGSTTTVTAPMLGAGQSIAATIEVAVTAPTSGTVISNQATVRSSQTSLITSNVVAHTVTTATVDLFLPIILKESAPVTDLRITSFTVTGTNPNRVVTIVIQNEGNTSTGEGFWVDFYVNPTTLPNNPALAGNRRWELTGSSQGIAWQIPALGPGESRTLTSNSTSGSIGPEPAPLSNWTGSLLGGINNLYAFVDSFALENVSYVEILESDESNNMASILGITVAGDLEIEPSSLPDLNNLPPRWKP